MKSLLAVGAMLAAVVATSNTAEAQQCFVNQGFSQPVVVQQPFVTQQFAQPVFVNRGFVRQPVIVNRGFVRQPIFVGRQRFIGSPFRSRAFIGTGFGFQQPVFVNTGPSFGLFGRRGGLFLNF